MEDKKARKDFDKVRVGVCHKMNKQRVEVKNIKYQNFINADIGKYKAEILGEKYCFDYLCKKLTKVEQLKVFDVIFLKKLRTFS